MPSRSSLACILSLVLLFSSLSGCGQKGDLYLPEKTAQGAQQEKQKSE